MEDFETPVAEEIKEEEEYVEEEFEEEGQVTFDDIVSFTMLLETAVMFIASGVFTVFSVL